MQTMGEDQEKTADDLKGVDHIHLSCPCLCWLRRLCNAEALSGITQEE
jgi:hypothetical protein